MRKNNILSSLIIILILVSVFSGCEKGSDAGEKVKIQRTSGTESNAELLYKFSEEIDYKSAKEVVFSEDLKHSAVKIYFEKEKKAYVIFDGEKQKDYRFISNLYFLENPVRLIYSAGVEDGKEVLVIDGEEIETFDDIENFTISPDKERYAFLAELKAESDSLFVGENVLSIFIDGEKKSETRIKYLGSYDAEKTFPIRFSPDSQRIAYVTYNEEKKELRVVRDLEIEGDFIFDTYTGILEFSPDSQHLVYKGGRSGDQYGADLIILDGEIQYDCGDKNHFDYSEFSQTLEFSQDSQHLAYIIKEKGFNGANWVVLDGKKEYSKHSYINNFYFSPDSQHLVYHTNDFNEDGIQKLFYDGEEMELPVETYRDIDLMGFDANGDLIYFIELEETEEVAVMFEISKVKRLVKGDQIIGSYHLVENFTFGPGNERFAFLASTIGDKKVITVVDGQEEIEADCRIIPAGIDCPHSEPEFHFSSDSETLIYRMDVNDKEVFVINGIAENLLVTDHNITNFTFDNKSGNFGYVADPPFESGEYFVVLNNKKKVLVQNVSKAYFNFTSNKAVIYFFTDDYQEFYRLEASL